MAVLMTVGLFSFGITADGGRSLAEAESAAQQLKRLGLFKGVSDTDFALGRAPSRVEALVMLIRILGKESEALSSGKTHPFNDVPDWADAYVGYAYSTGLTNGISKTEFGTSDASAATYLTFVLRALGYSDTNGKDFTWDAPFELAKKAGILSDGIDTDEFLRADVALVSKNALFAKINGTDTTLAQKLIADGAIGKAAYDKVFPTESESDGKEDDKVVVDISKLPDPITVSFRSEEYFEANSTFYIHGNDLEEGGKYEFTDGALRLLYSKPAGKWQGQYRVMFHFETVNFITDQHKYMQVTYRTDAKSGELRFHNNGSSTEWKVLSADVSESTGEWVRSEIVELSEAMMTRLNNSNPMTVCLHTDAENVNFELKEIKLYCDPAQAAAEIAKEEAAQQTVAAPVIYKFESLSRMQQSGVKFYDHGESSPTEEGVFEFAEHDGQKVLKLSYDRHNWAGNYRVMFRPMTSERARVLNNSETWFVRVRYKTDADTYSQMKLVNNQHGKYITLEKEFGTLDDGWCVSLPLQMPDDFVQRLLSGMWLTLGFDFIKENLNVYVSEIAFFPTIEAACDYYGDITADEIRESAAGANTDYAAMLMSDQSNVKILASDPTSDTAGHYERDPQTGNVIVKYIEPDKYGWGHYRFMPSFVNVPMTDAKYIRIVYKAQNSPNEEKPVALRVVSNAAKSILTVEDNVQNTNGEWVLSPVQEMSPIIKNRWVPLTDNMHCTVSFYAEKTDAVYEVREILFFRTIEDALAYELYETSVELAIAGNSIDKYSIVIPENAGVRTASAAETLRTHIFNSTGSELNIVTDDTPAGTYEIIVGNTNRAESAPYYNGETGKYVTGEKLNQDYVVFVQNGKLVFTAGSEIALEEGVYDFMNTHFGYRWAKLPKKIDLAADFRTMGFGTLIQSNVVFDDPKPVDDPIVFTDSFNDEKADASPDYWIEAYATDNWKVKADGTNLVYGTSAKDFTYTRLHVYERDIDYTVKMRFDTLGADSDAGLLVRYNDVGAYVRVGYSEGKWYLRFSRGQEFNVYTLDTADANVKAGVWYTVRVTATKNDVKVYIDGKETLSSSYVTHISPGPMGMFAENAAVSFDDVSVTLVSGQGRVMKGVTDSTFWTDESWLCSGSIIEMKDGTLRYVHSNEAMHYVSTDGGLTWVNEKFTDVTTDCVNIFRLASGKLIKLMEEKVNGVLYHVSYTSSDEGKTWARGGNVAAHDYMGYGTMIQTIENDKFTQISNGRIFLSQNYQGTIPGGQPNAHMKVFNEMWYSDDEGKSWTKCKQSSFDLTNITHFGESKVIETADGALLWVTPWNNAGYIIAAESTDNGETWGDFYNLMQFPCATSSFGIMRDPYADNNTTYYMAWVYNTPSLTTMPRSRLSIAMTTDGRNWTFLGDVYRWENDIAGTPASSSSALINHIVDPFLTVTEDYIFVGSGFAARRSYENNGYHNNQQQKVYRIEKDALVPYDEFPSY